MQFTIYGINCGLNIRGQLYIFILCQALRKKTISQFCCIWYQETVYYCGAPWFVCRLDVYVAFHLLPQQPRSTHYRGTRNWMDLLMFEDVIRAFVYDGGKGIYGGTTTTSYLMTIDKLKFCPFIECIYGWNIYKIKYKYV